MSTDGEFVMHRCSINGEECIGFQMCATCSIAHEEERRMEDDFDAPRHDENLVLIRFHTGAE